MKKHCLTFLFCCGAACASAQTTATHTLAGYVKEIQQFTKSNPQEKVFLHFDNTGYFVGETIWFKAYTVLAYNLQPHPLSKILHVELLAPDGRILERRQFPIDKGGCHGEFELKAEYRSGFYEVRAYTRSMLNFGEDCVFSRVFPVYEKPEKEGNYKERVMDASLDVKNERTAPTKEKSLNLQFYPEGGHAVTGLPTRVAFKATDRTGQDVAIQGTLYNSKNEFAASLQTLHQGMGMFEFTPDGGTYRLKVESNGKTHELPLSLPLLSQGYAMNVNNLQEDNLIIELSKSPSIPADTLALSVSCRGMVYGVEAFVLGEEPYVYRIDKRKLPAGCLQITAYNKNGQVLAERLAFQQKTSWAQAEIRTDKTQYQPFERVNVDVELHSSSGGSTGGTFSLAVRDAGTTPQTAYRENLLTDLLLSSDVSGYIENPMQYFVRNDRVTRTKLDLLMMVQGWRRYDWQLMAGVKPFSPHHYAEEGHQILGKVLSFWRRKPQADVDVRFWMLKGATSLRGTCRTDEEGRFQITLPDTVQLSGKWRLGLETTKKGKRIDTRVLIDRHFSPKSRGYTAMDMQVADTLQVFGTDSVAHLSLNHIQLLPEVEITKRRSDQPLQPDIVCDVEQDCNDLIDKDERFPGNGTVKDYLEYRVPGLRYDKYRGTPLFIAYEFMHTGLGAARALVNDSVFKYDTLNIERVKEIRIYYKNLYAWGKVVPQNSPSWPGPNTPSVLVMLVMNEDPTQQKWHKGIRQTVYYGYSESRKFHNPDHRNAVPGDTDYRRTLYWNPDVQIGQDGRTTLHFYNNSSSRKMQFSLQGFTANGEAVVEQE